MTPSRPKFNFLSFWTRVQNNAPSGCWEWTGKKEGGGYGSVQVGKVRLKAHRVAYEMAFGPVPEGLGVLHHCDNTICVNPSHLYAGTQKENALDRKHRGRGGDLRGENNGRAKLTADDVAAINAQQDVDALALARKYGVSREMIYRIKNGKAWRHVNGL